MLKRKNMKTLIFVGLTEEEFNLEEIKKDEYLIVFINKKQGYLTCKQQKKGKNRALNRMLNYTKDNKIYFYVKELFSIKAVEK